MNRIFFRFFGLVMLSITAATFVIYFAFARLFGDPLEDIARRQAAAQIFVLEHYIDQAGADEWLTRLNNVRAVSSVRYDLLPMDSVNMYLDQDERARLARGELLIDPSSKQMYRRVDRDGSRYIGSDTEVLVAQNLPIDIGQALLMEVLRYVIVALALLVPIALWSRSHWHSLQTLSSMADAFGSGQLSARTRLPRSAVVYPLAQRFNLMADRIESLMQAQRTLLHSVSHELRTPIARLEFGLELLGARADDPALHKRIAAMEGDLQELNNLVNELLDMGKLDSAQSIRFSTVDVVTLLDECRAALPPAAIALDVLLEPDLGALPADARLLGRALGNLLRNAQKYASSQVLLSASRSDSHLEIIVEDDGPGIPDEEREQVFVPFYRLDRSRDRATGGFGLGLAIARKAVELHGGTLELDRPVKTGARLHGARLHGARLPGARFILRLPLAVPAAQDIEYVA